MSLGVVVLFILALVTFISTVINGATLMSFASAAGADPSLSSSDWLKFGTALVALVGSILGVIILSRLQRGSTFISLFVLTSFQSASFTDRSNILPGKLCTVR